MTSRTKNQVATNHLKQELLCEMKHYISSLQQDVKTDYMDDYIKAKQDQIVSLKRPYHHG